MTTKIEKMAKDSVSRTTSHNGVTMERARQGYLEGAEQFRRMVLETVEE